MKPKEALTRAKERAADVLRDPINQQRAQEAAGRVGSAAIDHVLGEFTKERKDGTRKVRKVKTAKALLRPIHTTRKVAQGAARAVQEEVKSVAKDTAEDVLRNGVHTIPVSGESHTESIQVHTFGKSEGEDLWPEPATSTTTRSDVSQDTPPWADNDMLRKEQHPGDEVIPWDEPIHSARGMVDHEPPPWDS